MAKFDVQSLLTVLQGDGVATLSKTTKADENKVNAVLQDALPVLIGKMSDNASTKEGAASLNKALNEHMTARTAKRSFRTSSARTRTPQPRRFRKRAGFPRRRSPRSSRLLRRCF